VRVGSQNTKKVTKIEEFSPDDRETITILANERLIVTNKDEIEIVHEALIREWRQLKEWVDEYREFLIWQERVREDRRFYEEKGKKKEDLLKDSKLLVAKDFLASYEEYVSDRDREFVKKSIKREKQKRNIKILTVLIVLLAISGFAVYGFWQKRVAEENEQISNKLNKKLIFVVDNLFAQGINKSKKKDINDSQIYESIISEFHTSKEKRIIKYVGYSYNNLGHIYAEQGKYDEAISFFKRSIILNPNDMIAYNNISMILFYKKQYSDAIIFLKQAIKINPKNYLFYNIGVAYFYDKKYIKSLFFLKKIENINVKKQDFS